MSIVHPPIEYRLGNLIPCVTGFHFLTVGTEFEELSLMIFFIFFFFELLIIIISIFFFFV